MNRQGQGAGTLRKQQRFFDAAVIGMKIFVKHFPNPKYPFWLFDGNCGSGINEDVGVMGSPLVMQLAADEARLLPISRRRFFYCDLDTSRMLGTQRLFEKDYPKYAPCSYLLPGDNEEALQVFAECIRSGERRPHLAIGLAVVDPNGWFYRSREGVGPPTGALVGFAQEFERIDLLLNLNFFTYRQMVGNIRKGIWAADTVVPSPLEVLHSLNRRHWLIGRVQVAQSRFLVAIGRNTWTDDHAGVGMHHLHSIEAQAILREIDGGGQVDFFNALSNLSRIPEAPRLSGGASRSNEAGQRALPLRCGGDPGASPEVSAVGDVRRTEQSEGNLP